MTETTSPQPSTGSSALHPSEIPALVENLERKIVNERKIALDDAVAVLEDVRSEWSGAMWAGLRAVLDSAIDRVLALPEA